MFERCSTHLHKVDIEEKVCNKVWNENTLEYDRITFAKCMYCGYVYEICSEHMIYKINETTKDDITNVSLNRYLVIE